MCVCIFLVLWPHPYQLYQRLSSCLWCQQACLDEHPPSRVWSYMSCSLEVLSEINANNVRSYSSSKEKYYEIILARHHLCNFFLFYTETKFTQYIDALFVNVSSNKLWTIPVLSLFYFKTCSCCLMVMSQLHRYCKCTFKHYCKLLVCRLFAYQWFFPATKSILHCTMCSPKILTLG